MADLGSHICAAWAAARAASLVREMPPRAVYLVAAGAALPDLLARAPHLVLESAALKAATIGLHTPACLVFACLFLAFLFEERDRRLAFLSLWAGTLLHGLLDVFQKAWPGSYYWLYPFTDWSPGLEVYSGKATILWIPFLAGAALALEVVHRVRASRRRAAPRHFGAVSS